MLEMNKNESNIEIVKNGEIMKSYNSMNTSNVNNIVSHLLNEDYDFIIYSDTNNETNIVNKKIINKGQSFSTDYETSDYQFILIEIKITDDKFIKIDLKNNLYNFCLTGNVLSKEFFYYYLQNMSILSKDINHEELEDIKRNEYIELVIIDDNVNKIHLKMTDDKDSIVLEKNNYILHK